MDVEEKKEEVKKSKFNKFDGLYWLSIITLGWSIFVRDVILYILGAILLAYSMWKIKTEGGKNG